MERRTYSQQVCVKRSGLALQRAGALSPRARVGIALSGGVDSFTLLKVLRIRQALLPFHIELMALHLNPGFDNFDHRFLATWLASQGISSHIEITDFGPRAHSSENRKKSPCFYCAMLRRKRLFELCRHYHLTHLAFGHNADDMASTFMLNTFRNGRIQTLEIAESFFHNSLLVIRPLLLVEKRHIRQAACKWQLPFWQNACPSSGKTARTEMEEMLSCFAARTPEAKKSLINALGRRELEQAEKRASENASIAQDGDICQTSN